MRKQLAAFERIDLIGSGAGAEMGTMAIEECYSLTQEEANSKDTDMPIMCSGAYKVSSLALNYWQNIL